MSLNCINMGFARASPAINQTRELRNGLTLADTEMMLKGIRRAFDDVVTLAEDWAHTLPAEYLLTVDIALAISTLNESHGGIGFPLKTYIEAPTKTFIRHTASPFGHCRASGNRRRSTQE
jgi:hypothetical protein